MRRILQVFLLLLTLQPLSIKAQTDKKHLSCGTSPDDLIQIYETMQAQRGRYGNTVQTRGVTSYVPVCFHLVAKADGTGRVNESKLLDMIDQWNKTYAANGLELQFYIKYLNYVDNDALYNTPRALSGANRAFVVRKSDAMNIYICGTADDGTDPNSVTLAYYLNRFSSDDAPYAADWVVMRLLEASRENSSTVEHEVGHFFTLPHTFLGFEASPFIPTTASPCAPLTIAYNGRNIAVEKVARTGSDANCSTAGDGFCDTEPDYNFGITKGSAWNNNNNPCVYNGIAKDPTCVAVNPDETNLMGYFIGCENKFSPNQVTAMKTDYANSSYRKYLRDGNVAQSTAPVGEATLITPVNNATTESYTNLSFDWSDVSGAYGYVFEISTFASFAANVKRYVVYNSNINITNTSTGGSFLTANRAYYWRVRAFGRYVTGTNFAVENKFTTGTLNSVKEIKGIEEFTVSPNPVSQASHVELRLNSESAFIAQVKWTNIAGQVVKNQEMLFNSGLNAQLLDISELNHGLYILTIESDKGILNKKVAINR